MFLFSKFNAQHLFRTRQFLFPCPTAYKSRNISKCAKTNTPHPPRDPPEDYNPTSFTHRTFDAPAYIQPLVFRPLCNDDILGPNAAKNKVYKNPEYFAYHRFSQVDLFVNAMRIRMQRRLQQTCPSDEDVESDEGTGYNGNQGKACRLNADKCELEDACQKMCKENSFRDKSKYD